jgi:pimeloyl-ACP methyl ester carboxylesterase
MAEKPTARKRLLKGFLILFLAGVIVLYLLLPAAMGVISVLPGGQDVGNPPPGFEEVTLTAGDGVELAAWYRSPENGAVIILIHGADNSRENVRPYAEMLASNGYGVLALDLRGHGESEGSMNRVGWQGTLDVAAAVNFLEDRPDVQAVGGLGISLGGEALLGAASQYPQIAAIAADGATQRSIPELLALESERPLVRNFTARVMYATVQLLSGELPPKPLIESLIEARSTQFMLIAAGENSVEVSFNRLFAETLGERGSLWIAPGVEHIGAFARYGQEYERRLITFFDGTLR